MTDKTDVENGLIKSETNPTVIETDGSGNSVTLTNVTIDGKKQLGLKLENLQKAGESQVTLISTTTGKNASYKVVVAETTRTDVVNLSSPAIAVADEDILVPASVLDKDGNVITDVEVLNDNTKGVDVTFDGTSVLFMKDKDDNIFIKIPSATNDTDGTFALVAQSSTFKVQTLTVKVDKKAEAKTIRGLKNSLALAASKDKTLTVADVVVEDQYGRVMKTADVVSYLNTNSKGILIEKADTSKDIVTLPNEADPVVPADNTIKHNAGVQVTAGAANGTQTLRFILADNDGTNPVAASTAESTVRVTDGTEYASYEIEEIGLTQAFDAEVSTSGSEEPGVKEFTVNGILNGGKVALEQSTDFTATISGGKAGSTASVANNEITVKLADLKENDANEEIDTEFTLKVTINATGEVLEEKFVVSPDKQKVTDFYFTNVAIAANHDDADKVTEAKLDDGEKVSTSAKFTDKDDAQITVATTDQYGNEEVVAIDANWKVTIVPEKVGQVTIADNGTKDAKATLAANVDEANVTIKLAIGNVVKEIKTVVK